MLDKLSIEIRMLIAFLLVMLVFTAGQYFSPPPPPAPPAAKETAKNAPAPAPGPAEAPSPNPAAPAGPLPGQVQASDVETFAIETDLFKVGFSNRGATIHNWVLKKYNDNTGKPLELVNQKALQGNAIPAPFSLAFRTPPSNDPNSKLYQVTRSPDGLGVNFEYSDGRMKATKSFQFTKDSYLVKVTSQVIDNNALVPHALQWRGGFGDSTGLHDATDNHTLYFDIANNSLVKPELEPGFFAKLFGNGTVVNPVSGNYAFAGIEDKYFAAVVLPAEGSSLELTTVNDNVPAEDGKTQPHIGAGLGGSGNLNFDLYVGPKDATHLRSVDKRLAEMIDWGWFFFIAQPLFIMMHWVVDHMTHNWGWAIVVLTFVINTVLFPLRLSSMKSAKKMQAIQPQVKKINEKFAGLKATDPRKADQNAELMDLYKAHGINPVGGCVPMLLQIPFFYALYKVLSITIELRGAPWLWIGDLSQPEAFAIRILPLLLVVSQFASQKLTPSPGMDPAQQKIMMFMPLLFGYMFWYASAGLVLYWLTSNVVSIAQQLLLNRNTPAPAVAVVVPPKKKK